MIATTIGDLEKMVLLRKDVLIKLPAYTKTNTRETTSKILIATLDAERYNPTHGEVVLVAKDCDLAKLGDTCFFHYLIYSAAYIRSTGLQPGMQESKKYGYMDINKVYLEVEGQPYLILSEVELDFVLRAEEIIMLNDNYLLEPVQLKLFKDSLGHKMGEVTFQETDSNIFIPHTDKVTFDKNKATVYKTPAGSPLNIGECVFMFNNCYIKPEYEYNNPLLQKELFIVKKRNIVAIHRPGRVPEVQPINL